MCSAMAPHGLDSTLEDSTVKMSSNEMFCGNAGMAMQGWQCSASGRGLEDAKAALKASTQRNFKEFLHRVFMCFFSWRVVLQKLCTDDCFDAMPWGPGFCGYRIPSKSGDRQDL